MGHAKLHPVGEVLSHLLNQQAPLPLETAPLLEACDRFLASDVAVMRDAPAFDQSAMDGYAVHADELQDASESQPTSLLVDGETAASPGYPAPLARGKARRIFTGAQIPQGATAVVMQENATRDGERVLISRPASSGANIRRQGENQRSGEPCLRAGSQLDPITLGWLASQDVVKVSVHRRPKVALIGTGSELRAPGTQVTPGSVPDSNRIVLQSYLGALGAECTSATRSADNRESLTAALRAAREADLIITTGGASVGDHDLVQDALLAAGGAVEFWKMALKPGKPVIVGRLGTATFLGLPGNPVSAAVTFRVFAQPLILRMAGDAAPHPKTLPIIAANEMRHRPGRVELARARLTQRDSGWMATLAARQSSAAHDAMIQFPSFVVIPSTHGDVQPGDKLHAIPHWGWRGQATSPFHESAPV